MTGFLGLFHSITQSPLAPLILFAIAAAITWLLRLHRLRLPWTGMAVGLAALLSCAALTYLAAPILFEDAETDIACISALVLRGAPAFPAPDAQERYIVLYGPLTYLAHIPFYLLLGETLFSFKLLGVSAFLVSLWGLYRICRRYAARGASLVGLGAACLVFFRYMGTEFWGRIDPVILLFTVLSIWAVVAAPNWLIVATSAITFAAIPNLKISGVAYLLPLLALLWFRCGWKLTAAALCLGAALFGAPFLLPQMSLRNYIWILESAAGHGIIPNFLLRNVQYSLLMLSPVLAIAYLPLLRRPRLTAAQQWYLSLTVLGMFLTCVLGAKSGAGSYHLLPYIVPILHLYFSIRNEPSVASDGTFLAFAISWTLTTLMLSTTHVQMVADEFRAMGSGEQIVSEVHRWQARYAGQTMEVGVGADFMDRRTRYAYLTTFAGQPYTLSGAAIRDLQLAHLEIPSATIRYIASCGTAVWLIPKDQVPFTAFNSYYEGYHAAFEENFREAFLSRYRKAASGEQFDVWSCGR